MKCFVFSKQLLKSPTTRITHTYSYVLSVCVGTWVYVCTQRGRKNSVLNTVTLLGPNKPLYLLHPR